MGEVRRSEEASGDVLAAVRPGKQTNGHHPADESESFTNVHDGPLRDQQPSFRLRRNSHAKAFRQLREDWYWVLLTGFLMYLSGFGPAPWFARIIMPITVLIVSCAIYRRWIVRSPRTR